MNSMPAPVVEIVDTKVDVLLRDLDAVEHWGRRAEQGEFEIDALLGYIAGVPTYLLSAELASCEPLRGAIPSAPFPEKLRMAAPLKWRFCRAFSLDYARMHARRGNVVGVQPGTRRPAKPASMGGPGRESTSRA
jgi:hypothetical protein